MLDYELYYTQFLTQNKNLYIYIYDENLPLNRFNGKFSSNR